MRYRVKEIKFWKDGTTTEITVMPKEKPVMDFEEASALAKSMMEHQWKFHQEYNKTNFYYLEEVK